MLARKCLVEFLGTFFLVLTIGLAVLQLTGLMVPLAIGSVLTAMIYGGGPISGAHYNPAVTIAFWMRGKFPTREVVPYIAIQVVAAVAAAFVVGYMVKGAPVAPEGGKIGPLVVAELLFTFALVFVILNVATSKRSEGNQYFGLAIGLTVVGGILAVGKISGAVFNPAVAVGISIMKFSPWGYLVYYLIANFVGGAVAAVVFLYLENDGEEEGQEVAT